MQATLEHVRESVEDFGAVQDVAPCDENKADNVRVLERDVAYGLLLFRTLLQLAKELEQQGIPLDEQDRIAKLFQTWRKGAERHMRKIARFEKHGAQLLGADELRAAIKDAMILDVLPSELARGKASPTIPAAQARDEIQRRMDARRT